MEVDGALDQDDVLAAREGMTLGDGTVCLPAELELLSSNSAHITLREGKYHQVKRMMASRGSEERRLEKSCWTLRFLLSTRPGVARSATLKI